MLNKTMSLPFFFLMCISLPSHAYVIGADLTIENKTDTPLEISVFPPNGEGPVAQRVSPHQTKTIYVENGDGSGRLYQASVAPFSIKDAENHTEYVNGRVAYYVGAAFWKKYSFLDSVVAAKGIFVDQTYSCANGGDGTIFLNKISLSGEPRDPATPANPNNLIRCEGLKASELNNDQYDVTCSDDTKAQFLNLAPNQQCEPGRYIWSKPTAGCYWWTGTPETRFAVDPHELQVKGLKFALDKGVAGQYCQTFAEKL